MERSTQVVRNGVVGSLRTIAVLLGVVCAALVAAHPATAGGACRPPLYTIDLRPLGASAAGSGTARIEPATTPFGMALTPDGHVIYTVQITLTGMPPASAMGGTQYVAWAVSPNLDRGDRLGTIAADGTAHGQISMNKFLIIVTAEPATVGPRWSNHVVLRGFSPSTFLQNFANEELFQGGMPPC